MTKRRAQPARKPCGGCNRLMLTRYRIELCAVCWQVEKVCTKEAVARLDELADPQRSKAALLWRVADVLRRSGVEDGESLVRRLEKIS